MTKRLFIAIPLLKYFRKELEEYMQQFSHIRGLRWTKRENLHITVQFLGEVKEEHFDVIVERLGDIAPNMRSFQLAFEKITFAPPNKEPNMIWATFSGNGQYQEFVKKVSSAMDEFVPQNLRGENVMRKARMPHITLARLKDPSLARSFNLSQAHFKKDTVRVVSFELWESKLTSEGPVYNVIEKFLLS